MRQIDPFSYFVEYASQLSGFGGGQPSPDPQYCFHTRYETVRPGRAIYSLKLIGAQSSQGELTVRVHAFRPDSGYPPSLAAGNRIDLEVDGRQDLEVYLPFQAIKGVDYALYGYFSEPTNLSVEKVEILLDEPADEEAVEIEAPRSLLAQPSGAPESGPATGLIHYDAVLRDRPVSQDCTWRQLQGQGATDEQLLEWREAVCLAALPCYGVDIAGLDGWALGPIHGATVEYLAQQRFALSLRDAVPDESLQEFADFLLWPHAVGGGPDGAMRWDDLYGWLSRLKVGGLGVVCISYDANTLVSVGYARNEIKKWVFRLIGMGYSVAPLAFAEAQDLAIDDSGKAAFCLIVRRQ